MKRIWRFVGQKRNRDALGWIGGGLVVVTSGIWAAIVYVPHQQQEIRPTEVEARCGGVAIGGSANRSTITGGATSGADCSTKPK
jgi:hypothetical protein